MSVESRDQQIDKTIIVAIPSARKIIRSLWSRPMFLHYCLSFCVLYSKSVYPASAASYFISARIVRISRNILANLKVGVTSPERQRFQWWNDLRWKSCSLSEICIYTDYKKPFSDFLDNRDLIFWWQYIFDIPPFRYPRPLEIKEQAGITNWAVGLLAGRCRQNDCSEWREIQKPIIPSDLADDVSDRVLSDFPPPFPPLPFPTTRNSMASSLTSQAKRVFPMCGWDYDSSLLSSKLLFLFT
jgi:hypothetical protein